MMTRLLTFTLLFTCVAITAQGQVAFSYPTALPEQGQHSFVERTAVWTGYSAAPPWNVTGLTFSLLGARELVWTPAASTPFAAQFPQATDCILDINQFPPSYDYYEVSSAGVAYWGAADTGPVEVLTEPFTFRVFPMMLSTGYNDTFILDGDTVFAAVNPLAKGDLLTPFGDVASVGVTEVVVDFGLGAEFSYLFYREGNAMMPVAQYDPDDQAMILYSPGNISPLAVPEQVFPAVTMGPNPVTNDLLKLRWIGATSPVDLCIISAEGRSVLQRRVLASADALDVDLHGLAPGTYAVRIEQKGAPFWQERFVLVR
ncbi:MAG: T9SS type A sorting domain-containing protein [Flavobacteriales bacterium]|nr:T9SS type A sorting domain-containing protein [Flavobacteriales bacterium]